MGVGRKDRSVMSVRVTSALLMMVLGFSLGCGGGSGGTDVIVDPGPDTTPPADIVDLRSSTITTTSITLNWTAPGDDGETGRSAVEYELRFATQTLTAQNWQAATRFPTGAPTEPGLTERITVTGLLPRTNYYFAVASVDDSDNRSGVSNFHAAATREVLDVIEPGTISDLRTGLVGRTSIELLWTATGDDDDRGTAFGYDILQLDREITEDNQAEAGGPATTPIPAPAGTPESWIIDDLKPATTYYFAVIVWDEARNRSSISNNVMVRTTSLASPARR